MAYSYCYFDIYKVIHMREGLSIREIQQPIYGENAISSFSTTCNPDQICFPLHWHERIEFIRITDGSLRLRVNDTDEQLVTQDEMVIICPQQIHGGIAGPDGVAYEVFAFELNSFLVNAPRAKMLIKLVADAKLGFVNRTSEPQVIDAFDRAMECASGDPLECLSRVYVLLGMLFRYCNPYEIKKNNWDEKIREILIFINENYLQLITTKSISEQFGYTSAYLCRCFKESMGVPVMKYIETLRLEKSRELLRQTTLSISNIALQCGYCDVCYYSYRFRKKFGITPTTYRHQREKQ